MTTGLLISIRAGPADSPEGVLIGRSACGSEASFVTARLQSGETPFVSRCCLDSWRDLVCDAELPVLVGGSFPRADLRDVDLRGAALMLADFYMAELSGADLYGADLAFADLRGARLRGADLRGADLSKSDLSGADLAGAYLDGADLAFAVFKEADLRGASLRGARVLSTSFAASRFDRRTTLPFPRRAADEHGMIFIRGADGEGAQP